MLISVSQTDFLIALQTVQKGTAAQSTLPILSGIKIAADKKDCLSMQSTDLEISIESECPASVKEKGAVVVNGKLMVDIVRHLDDGAIHISLEEEGKYLSIKMGKSTFKLQTLASEDFPEFPTIEAKEKLEIESSRLQGMLKQTKKAISKDETRPVLTGALLKVSDGNMLVVATDSYRLAIKEAPAKTKKETSISVIIPSRAIEEAQKLVGNDDKPVVISSDGNMIKIEGEGFVLVTRLIEGQFPNYDQLIPKETTLKINVSKEDIVGAISRVAVLAQKNMSIKVGFEDKEISIKSATPGIGEAKEMVKVKRAGEKIGEMAFNAQYLLEGLQGVESDMLDLEFTATTSPGLIRSSPSDDYLYLVMPIRLN